MCRGPLVGLTGSTEHRKVTKDEAERSERHRQWDQRTRSLQR